MQNLSPILTITWNIAAYEANRCKHEFIEREHLFIGLCNVTDALQESLIKSYNAAMDLTI
jgi:hypothetical protein